MGCALRRPLTAETAEGFDEGQTPGPACAQGKPPLCSGEAVCVTDASSRPVVALSSQSEVCQKTQYLVDKEASPGSARFSPLTAAEVSAFSRRQPPLPGPRKGAGRGRDTDVNGEPSPTSRRAHAALRADSSLLNNLPSFQRVSWADVSSASVSIVREPSCGVPTSANRALSLDLAPPCLRRGSRLTPRTSRALSGLPVSIPADRLSTGAAFDRPHGTSAPLHPPCVSCPSGIDSIQGSTGRAPPRRSGSREAVFEGAISALRATQGHPPLPVSVRALGAA